MYEDIFIGLGSNLDEPEKQLSVALEKLSANKNVSLLKTSSFYKTAPIGTSSENEADTENQPDYVNAVCQIESILTASELLKLLLDIEKQSGRVRTIQRNSARTLDLDLLMYGDSIINTADLTVPHPRLHNRAFVLYPLVEIAPRILIPGIGEAATLINNVSAQKIEKLGARDQ